MSALRTLNGDDLVPVKEGEPPGARSPERMAGLAKGLAVIETFDHGRPRLTVTDAARAAGLSRATARRCLLTLTELGFLAFDGKHYAPTPRMARLGASYLEAAPLPVLARPHLAAARDALGESVSLAVLEDGWSVFVARAEAERIVSTGVRLGARVPAHCCATGRVLLAALPDAEVDRYLAQADLTRRTARSVDDPDRLRAIVRAARAEGVAFADEEIELGLRALAIPVRDATGATVAAMSASTSTGRATVETLRGEFLPVVREHADRLGRML